MVKVALIAGFLTFIFAFITILGFFMVVLSPEEYISHVDAKIENVVRAKKFREDSTCNMAYYSYEMNNKTYKGSTLFNEGDALKIGDTISIAFDKIKPKRFSYPSFTALAHSQTRASSAPKLFCILNFSGYNNFPS